MPPPTQLLSLPYDIRYLIYQHLLPQTEQLYIQAFPASDRKHTLQVLLPDASIPTAPLLVCRALHSELSELLYNSYLFNLVGTKKDCLAGYRPFLRTLRLYARKGEVVHVNAFSNGGHSATMCLSLQAGEGKMGVLNERQRGLPRTLRELEEEQELERKSRRSVGGQMDVRLLLCFLLTVWVACFWRYGGESRLNG